MSRRITTAEILPQDKEAVLVGRIWSKKDGGPCPVLVDGERLLDLSRIAATVSELLELPDWSSVTAASLPDLGPIDDYLSGGLSPGPRGKLLPPSDLQPIKAAGVTFVDSMLERVVEERSQGRPEVAEKIRASLVAAIGDNLAAIVPGSESAQRAKETLKEMGYWSQYLEVGIGPDAEIFTKAPPLSAVGCGAMIGINPISSWNNPEPEIVLAVNSRGDIRGATLGNDVNLRDVEGRSALLLGKAKDNNGACAIGPFIRLVDEKFSLSDIRRLVVRLRIAGEDGFKLEGTNDLSRISRDVSILVKQAINDCHQYPDGFLLFLGTMFAPVDDRSEPGLGFTHRLGDEVHISSPKLGALINWVDHSDKIERWTFGIGALMRNLAERRLLG